MCNEFNPLVELSDWRYVAQCEHSTIHLRWDHLTISLPPQSFLHLARTLLQAAQADNALVPGDTGQPLSSNALPAALRIRLNTVLLAFEQSDLPHLCHLLEQAIGRVTSTGAAPELPVRDRALTLQPCPQPAQSLGAPYLN